MSQKLHLALEEKVFTEKDKDPGARMLVPFAVLVAAMLILGIHAEPLMNTLERLIAGGM